jgi:hypothetical protein
MATVLLLTALVLPVVLFWLLKSRSRLNALIVAGIAIAVGWALNLAWASAAHESLAIAGAFGWVCPAVLVLLTWLVWRFAKRRAEP